MHLWQDQAVEAVEMSYKWSSFGEEVGGGSMHSRVEGEAFSIYIPNPGSRTAGALSFFLILSHFCSRWHGPGHYKSPCWNGPINASCPQDRTGTPLCGSCAAGFLQTLGKRKKKSASRCISYSPGNRTANLTPDCQWNNFGSEWLPPRSCESHFTFILHGPSCSSLQGNEALRSLWRLGVCEQLWSFCASHPALQTAAWSAVQLLLIPSFLVSWFWQRNTNYLVPATLGAGRSKSRSPLVSEVGQDPVGQLQFIVWGFFKQGEN